VFPGLFCAFSGLMCGRRSSGGGDWSRERERESVCVCVYGAQIDPVFCRYNFEMMSSWHFAGEFVTFWVSFVCLRVSFADGAVAAEATGRVCVCLCVCVRVCVSVPHKWPSG